ncbi:hypothetical protein R80B4_01523 [Fibrobacteres bacterium R8-0-B4]
MPLITAFYGIIITMYWNEHLPAHFHANYGEFEALFDLDGNVIEGELPNNKRKLVEAWALLHKEELAVDWKLVQNRVPVMPIDPLK